MSKKKESAEAKQRRFFTLRRVTMLTGCLLDSYSDISSLKVYRHELKNYGNLFMSELSKLENGILKPIGKEDKDFVGAVSQANLLYKQTAKLIDLTFMLSELPQDKQLGFEQEMKELLAKYSINEIG